MKNSPRAGVSHGGIKPTFGKWPMLAPVAPPRRCIMIGARRRCTCGQPDCSVLLDNDCDRWLEIWNLVFMQFNQSADGTPWFPPAPNPAWTRVWVWSGLWRWCKTRPVNYDTDLFQPLIKRTQALLGHSDKEQAENEVAYRVIADHGRAITFMTGDGVMPGNEGRAYILRLILRRASRYGAQTGLHRTLPCPKLPKL